MIWQAVPLTKECEGKKDPVCRMVRRFSISQGGVDEEEEIED